jgi:hypothetical protein
MHDLPHTVGTYAGQSGANAFLVRDLLRHKSNDRALCEPCRQSRATLSDVGERIAAALADLCRREAAVRHGPIQADGRVYSIFAGQDFAQRPPSLKHETTV